MKNLFYVFSVSFLKKQFANKLFAFLLFLFLLLPKYACNTTEPLIPPEEQPPKAIKLKLMDVSCTEAFISVNAADSVLPVAITLKKDNTTLFSFTLTKTDTIVIDTTLQPNITYVYQTTAQIKGKEENSDTIQVKTLNTTSHNFTWQTFTFGGIGGSSILNDVAIIDENNIWAVGEIYADTTGLPFNAVHWDGSSWELKRISVDYNGNNITPPLYGIFTFSANDIWLSSGVPVHGDGTNWVQYHLFDMGVLGQNDGYLTKILGNSSNDLYYVGTLGTIAHYQNGVWSKIESGTDWDILDIWSDKNPFTNEQEILCCIGKSLTQPGPWSDIIRIKNDFTIEHLDLTGLGQVYGHLWFKSGSRYYVVGDGLYEKTYRDTTQWIDLNKNREITSYHMSCITGTGLNNIVVGGNFGEVLQYNGVNWQSYKSQTSLTAGTYFSVAIKEKTVVLVGSDGRYGRVALAIQQ